MSRALGSWLTLSILCAVATGCGEDAPSKPGGATADPDGEQVVGFDTSGVTPDASRAAPDAEPADVAIEEDAAEDSAAQDAQADDAQIPDDVVDVASPFEPDATAPDVPPATDVAVAEDAAPTPADVGPIADAVADTPGPGPDATGPDAAAADTATPPAEPVVRFAAIGDTGKANDTQYKVGAALAKHCKEAGCDFVMMLGDNFYNTGVTSENDGQFKTKFEEPYKDVDAPFYVVLGNHDYGGEGAGYELWKADYYKKYSKKNPKFHFPDTSWQKVVGHVHLFGIDSNLMMYGLGGPQVSELGPQITKSTAEWKIGFAHHPYLSNGKHGNAGTYEGFPGIPIVSGDGVKKAYDQIVCGKLDVHLAGHDHSRQWLNAPSQCGGTELIVSGAGASTTEIKKKDNLFNKVNPAWYADAGQGGFFWAEIKGKHFLGRFYDLDGKLSYERSFTKP